MFKFKSTSEEQTEKFGGILASALTDESVIALDGDLGAGKTCLARGIARGLGVTSFVSSPTFTIVISGVLPRGTIRMRITGSGDERVFEADDAAKEAAQEAGCEIL